MKILSTIEEIIISDHKIPVRGEILILSEKKESTCQTISLTKSGRLVVLRFDQEESVSGIFPFFNPNLAGLNKMCDYLLFYNPRLRDELFVFLCDMKAEPAAKGFEQLRAAHIFADFLVKTAARQLKDRIPIIQYRGLVFSAKASTGKGLTHPRNNAYKPISNELGYRPLPCKCSYNLSALCY